MSAVDWFLLGAPWDCSGTARGEQAAPDALRAAGLSALVGQDLGDAVAVVDSTDRDEDTGVLALPETVRAAHAVADALGRALQDTPDRRPLVVGGTAASCSASSLRCAGTSARSGCGSSTGTRTFSMDMRRRPARQPTWTWRC